MTVSRRLQEILSRYTEQPPVGVVALSFPWDTPLPESVVIDPIFDTLSYSDGELIVSEYPHFEGVFFLNRGRGVVVVESHVSPLDEWYLTSLSLFAFGDEQARLALSEAVACIRESVQVYEAGIDQWALGQGNEG